MPYSGLSSFSFERIVFSVLRSRVRFYFGESYRGVQRGAPSKWGDCLVVPKIFRTCTEDHLGVLLKSLKRSELSSPATSNAIAVRSEAETKTVQTRFPYFVVLNSLTIVISFTLWTNVKPWTAKRVQRKPPRINRIVRSFLFSSWFS